MKVEGAKKKHLKERGNRLFRLTKNLSIYGTERVGVVWKSLEKSESVQNNYN